MMLRYMKWTEAADLIIKGVANTIAAKERLMTLRACAKAIRALAKRQAHGTQERRREPAVAHPWREADELLADLATPSFDIWMMLSSYGKNRREAIFPHRLARRLTLPRVRLPCRRIGHPQRLRHFRDRREGRIPVLAQRLVQALSRDTSLLGSFVAAARAKVERGLISAGCLPGGPQVRPCD